MEMKLKLPVHTLSASQCYTEVDLHDTKIQLKHGL